MEKLENMENDRRVIFVRADVRITDDYFHEDKHNGIKTFKPGQLYNAIFEYQHTTRRVRLIDIVIKEIPERGSCDTRPHEVTMGFQNTEG
jgi:hypothetical protein